MVNYMEIHVANKHEWLRIIHVINCRREVVIFFVGIYYGREISVYHNV